MQKKFGQTFYQFEKIVPATHLHGQAKAVYVKIFNAKGEMLRMYKDSYRIDGRFLHRRMLKPNETGIYKP